VSRLLVVAETAYPETAPAARVRVVEMGAHLEPEGVQLEHRPMLTCEEYRRIADSGAIAGKVLTLSRHAVRAARMSRPRDGALTLVQRLRSLVPTPGDRRHLDVYDLDDAIYLRSPYAHNPSLRMFKREAARCARYMRRARLVVAGNQLLADAARMHASRVEIVPSCVDPAVQPRRQHAASEVLTLGWTGSATTANYLRPVLGAVASMHDRGRPVRLILMGALLAGSAPWIEHRSWSPEGERRMLTEIDVGVMPVLDDPWSRAKCGYKLLRYFSAGLPAIASPVGLNSRLLADGRGIAAGSSAEWSAAIDELAGDVELRRQMGSEARSFVEREYSYQVWAPRLAELLRELAGV
jgi:glycosyltransferase involved in cell wall biosynthesis